MVDEQPQARAALELVQSEENLPPLAEHTQSEKRNTSALLACLYDVIQMPGRLFSPNHRKRLSPMPLEVIVDDPLVPLQRNKPLLIAIKLALPRG
jgi:hypothetical protein